MIRDGDTSTKLAQVVAKVAGSASVDDLQIMTRFAFGCGPSLWIAAGICNHFTGQTVIPLVLFILGLAVMALAFAGPGLSSATFDVVKGKARFDTRKR